MTNLAIKGHKTRGKEVIEILEMLGGKTSYECSYKDGFDSSYVFFINTDENFNIDGLFLCNNEELKKYYIFTLEEFIEKFPYKVGDKAIAFGNKCTVIDAVWDESIKEIVYTIKLDTSKYTTTKLSNQLQPYKEETMKSKSNLLQQLKEYFNNTPREVIEKEWHEYDKYNEIGPKVNEYLEYVNKSRQPEYPKTYDECCDVLEIKYSSYCVGYQEELLDNFQQLIVCRDAYWKIAGWNPKVKSDVFYMNTLPSYLRDLFPMPTEEMRYNFFNNFKELFESCKAFL